MPSEFISRFKFAAPELRQMLQVSQDGTEQRKCLCQPIFDSSGVIFLSKCPWRQSLSFKEVS